MRPCLSAGGNRLAFRLPRRRSPQGAWSAARPGEAAPGGASPHALRVHQAFLCPRSSLSQNISAPQLYCRPAEVGTLFLLGQESLRGEFSLHLRGVIPFYPQTWKSCTTQVRESSPLGKACNPCWSVRVGQRDSGRKCWEAPSCDLWGCKSGAIESHLPRGGEHPKQAAAATAAASFPGSRRT